MQLEVQCTDSPPPPLYVSLPHPPALPPPLSQALGSAVESEEDSGRLAFWLSNTSTLLFLLQRTLRAAAGGHAGGAGGQRRRSGGTPGALFGRMSQVRRRGGGEGQGKR